MIVSKSRIINSVIALLLLVGLGGIMLTQSLIHDQVDKNTKMLQAQISANNDRLTEEKEVNQAWRDALAEYNKNNTKLIVPQVVEPTPAPTPATVRRPVIKPSKPVPTPAPRVITRTIYKKAKTPKPTPKPWWKYFNSTR